MVDEVLPLVPYRQLVFTIPRRLRKYFLFDRSLYGHLCRTAAALTEAGFVKRHVAGVDLFLDAPSAKARDAVHVVFAGEKVRPEYPAPAPAVTESETTAAFRLVSLEALVRMKLMSFRDKDRMHLRNLLGVGLVDAGWLRLLEPELRARLQQILDTPEG